VKVAIVHDYLTQRGGAERVVLSMLKAFPGAPLYTSLYEPDGTFPEFRSADVRTLILDRLAPLRRRHRLALPLLARAFSSLEVSADVVLCSSSGWAHGTTVRGRKIVYCHSPARWLYQAERYLGDSGRLARTSLRVLRPYLLRWDRNAARTADGYLANSRFVGRQVAALYGIEPHVVPPPYTLDPADAGRASELLEPGYFLSVTRLLPYKNVDVVVTAFRGLPARRLVVVGTGPEEARLRALASPNVRFLGSVSDEELRWLYANCSGVVAAAHEDYGLTPLEAAAFGKPAAVLRWGGFLDTVVEGRTGVFFDAPRPEAVQSAVVEVAAREWDASAVRSRAESYSEERFVERLREVVEREGGGG
jgi:glycosyltransferase involved in cell wall biosynthesis